MAPTKTKKKTKSSSKKSKNTKDVATPIAPSLPITKAAQKRGRLDVLFKDKSNEEILGIFYSSLRQKPVGIELLI